MKKIKIPSNVVKVLGISNKQQMNTYVKNKKKIDQFIKKQLPKFKAINKDFEKNFGKSINLITKLEHVILEEAIDYFID